MIENTAHLADATYTDQVLPEYSDNPFIEALPPIWPATTVVSLLAHDPAWHEGEREMDAGYRFHCVWRLFRYFQPLDTHIDIEQRISRAIRQGYIGKNPLEPAYARQLGLGHQMIQERSEDFKKFYSGSAGSFGFTIIGMSGVGKTTAVERILSLYPQAIQHSRYKGQPLCLTQLSWVKIDCPFDGSLKGLCLNFFDEVDRILGTDYLQKFLKGVHTIDALLPRMAQIATLHGVGLLVIDEIQHLSLAKSGGSDKMLNFFVTLVNTIGVPVILIGTTKAMSVLQGDFRQARRGSGQGDLLWDRMENNAYWDILIENMWVNQWTRKQIPLTKEIREVLYDESQGIIDIAVKLYAMAQIKAIATRTESFDASAIRQVAVEKLRLVKPMLDALRSGDARKLAKYEDIRPISIEDYAAAYLAHLPPDTDKHPTAGQMSLEEQVLLKLLEMDIPATVAKRAVRRAMRGANSGQPLADVLRKAFKIALSIEDAAEPPAETEPADGDLRQMSGDMAYEDLKAAGIIAGEDEF
jgi:hypothetical protein